MTFIDPINTALYGAFMMEGMRDQCGTSAGYAQLLEAWNNGCFELVSEMTQYAAYIEQLLHKLQEGQDLEWPGVFEYEVCGPFGYWFAGYVLQHGYAPPSTEAEVEIDRLITDYFAQ